MPKLNDNPATLIMPKSKIAAEVIALAREAMSPGEAQRWILVANEDLGGQSPVEAIRDGRFDDVLAAARALKRDEASR